MVEPDPVVAHDTEEIRHVGSVQAVYAAAVLTTEVPREAERRLGDTGSRSSLAVFCVEILVEEAVVFMEAVDASIVDIGRVRIGLADQRQRIAAIGRLPVATGQIVLSDPIGVEHELQIVGRYPQDLSPEPGMRIELGVRLPAVDQPGLNLQVLRRPVLYPQAVEEPGDPRVRLGDQPVELPGRELSLLEALGARVGSVVSRDTISSRLCKGFEPVSASTIEVSMHRLRRRLAPFGLQIRTVRGFGYVLENPATRSWERLPVR